MRTLFISLAAMTLATGIASCNRSDEGTFLSSEPKYSLTVNEAMENAPQLVDSMVSITGRCVHLCDYADFYAYIMAPDSSIFRCVATARIGGAFPDSILGRNVVVEGMLRDQNLTIEGIHNLDEQYKMHVQILRDYNLDDETQMLDSHRRCQYERKFRNQEYVVLFDESTADYRKKIEDRKAKEGKDYITYYYLEATNVKTLD